MKICPECGKELDDKYEFCSNCGYSFKDKEEIENKDKISGTEILQDGVGPILQNKKIIIAIIAVILIIIIAFFTFSGGSTSDSSDSSVDASTPPITVESCVATEDSENNDTKISVSGVATKDIGTDDNLIYAESAAITTEDGEIVQGSGMAVEWAVVHKGEPIHFTIHSYEKLKSNPEKISFKVTGPDKDYNDVNYGFVTANVTQK